LQFGKNAIIFRIAVPHFNWKKVGTKGSDYYRNLGSNEDNSGILARPRFWKIREIPDFFGICCGKGFRFYLPDARIPHWLFCPGKLISQPEDP